MTDNDPTPPSPRLHLPDRLKIGLQRLRLEALESLQNLRAYEYTGTTLNRTVAIKSPNDWPTVHRSTLEDLLRVTFEYYRRLHDENDLKKAVLRLFATDIPDLPPHPDYITFEETHECTEPMHSAFHLDLRALEMLTIDQLVDQIYADRLIKRDLHGFVTRVPVLCEYFRTPLFHSSQAKFYELVVDAFEQHPNRDQIPWASTPAIHQVRFSKDAPIVGQLATIADPFA
jgi:hypothetical protein